MVLPRGVDGLELGVQVGHSARNRDPFGRDVVVAHHDLEVGQGGVSAEPIRFPQLLCRALQRSWHGDGATPHRDGPAGRTRDLERLLQSTQEDDGLVAPNPSEEQAEEHQTIEADGGPQSDDRRQG